MKILIYLYLMIFGTFVYSQNITNDLEILAKTMEGNYNTSEQSKIDSGYFDIRLHMKRIWNDRNDAIWLYVEQAIAQAQNKPYRQRVYRLTQKGYNLFESEIYELPEPLRFTGEWKELKLLKTLTYDSLINKGGCAVTLKKLADGIYSGSTDSKNCLSGWRGAKYTTSIVTIIKEGLISWDRGFGEKDEYLWGAEKAGYFFKKE